MNQSEFTKALERQFQQAGRSFARAAVLAYVEDAWPLIADDPDVHGWARLFLHDHPEPVMGQTNGVSREPVSALGKHTRRT
jgi:hypothetical protein